MRPSNKKRASGSTQKQGTFSDVIWEKGYVCVNTVIDTAVHPFLILDKKLTVISANEKFYSFFNEKLELIENHPFQTISGGVWNDQTLILKLKEIFSKESYFKGFELSATFPDIGKKTLLLNARRVYYETSDGSTTNDIALVAIDDATDLLNIAEMITQKRNYKI